MGLGPLGPRAHAASQCRQLGLRVPESTEDPESETARRYPRTSPKNASSFRRRAASRPRGRTSGRGAGGFDPFRRRENGAAEQDERDREDEGDDAGENGGEGRLTSPPRSAAAARVRSPRRAAPAVRRARRGRWEARSAAGAVGVDRRSPRRRRRKRSEAPRACLWTGGLRADPDHPEVDALALVLRDHPLQPLHVGLALGQIADQHHVRLLTWSRAGASGPERGRRDDGAARERGRPGVVPEIAPPEEVEPALQSLDRRRGRERLVGGVGEDDEPEVAPWIAGGGRAGRAYPLRGGEGAAREVDRR